MKRPEIKLAINVIDGIQSTLNNSDFTELLSNYASECDPEDIISQTDLEKWAERNEFVPVSYLEEAQDELKEAQSKIQELESQIEDYRAM